jgi:hypothetical protein
MSTSELKKLLKDILIYNITPEEFCAPRHQSARAGTGVTPYSHRYLLF